VTSATPALTKDAFLNGYERDLTGSDTETPQHLGALDALTAIARGHQKHDIQLVQYGYSTLRQLRASVKNVAHSGVHRLARSAMPQYWRRALIRIVQYSHQILAGVR
jgi:hypothetical protein